MFMHKVGCGSIPKTGSTAGKAIADGVTLAKTSNRTLLNGKEIKDNYGTISELYWSSITKVPDVSKYVIEVNGSDEEDNTKPGKFLKISQTQSRSIRE